jgi:predicted Zn-dependent protease
VTAGIAGGIIYISAFQLYIADKNSSFTKGALLIAMAPQNVILYDQTSQTSVSQNSVKKESAKSKKVLVRTPNKRASDGK